ncbi:MAG: hypothetical protein QF384_19265 [Alphaproteobacteria bacterium]|nr:hypothetical protein [Alphaproteobacteria bacterium]MDP6830076.1 hypothetical protein [Alphaproteobacteria bacterium]
MVSEWRNMAGFLRLTSAVTAQTGNAINVNEGFTMTFTVINTAPAPDGNNPRIRYTGVSLRVNGTQWASVDGGNQVIDFPDQLLESGQSTSVAVPMTAVSNMGDTFFGAFADLFAQEQIARARVIADLDRDAYFHVWTPFQDIHEEIS